MATDHKATVSKGNRMNIQNRLKEGEFTCADAYYIWCANNAIELVLNPATFNMLGA